MSKSDGNVVERHIQQPPEEHSNGKQMETPVAESVPLKGPLKRSGKQYANLHKKV